MKQHAVLAPSSAKQTVQCSGSVVMQQRYPELGDPLPAQQGEAAHWVLEEVLEGVILSPNILAPNGIPVEREMIHGADVVVRDIMSKLGENWRSLIHVEETLPPDPVLHPENWGTPDVWAFHNGTLFIWDFKYGFDPVPAFENWQLINYFALLFAMLSRADQIHDDRLVTVRICIVQPRDYSSRQGMVKEWTANGALLRAHVNILRNAFAEALGPNPRLRIGSSCEYCTARAACPELQKAGLREAELAQYSAPFDLPADVLGRELQALERAQDVLKARSTGLSQQAIKLIGSGKQVPGYGIDHGEGRLVWKKPAAEIINTGRLVGFDLQKPAEAITPKQALDAGLQAEIVAANSHSPRGAAKLVKDDPAAVARGFGINS